MGNFTDATANIALGNYIICVRIKADAVDNANHIAGYDDATVPAAGAK